MRRPVLRRDLRRRGGRRRRRDLHNGGDRYDPLERVYGGTVPNPQLEAAGGLVLLFVVHEDLVGLCEPLVNGLVLPQSLVEFSDLALGGLAENVGVPEGVLFSASTSPDSVIAEVPCPTECRCAARGLVGLGSEILLNRKYQSA